MQECVSVTSALRYMSPVAPDDYCNMTLPQHVLSSSAAAL